MKNKYYINFDIDNNLIITEMLEEIEDIKANKDISKNINKIIELNNTPIFENLGLVAVEKNKIRLHFGVVCLFLNGLTFKNINLTRKNLLHNELNLRAYEFTKKSVSKENYLLPIIKGKNQIDLSNIPSFSLELQLKELNIYLDKYR